EGTGIVQLDAQGSFSKHFSKATGLGDNFLYSAFADQDGQLWLGPRHGGVAQFNSQSGQWKPIDLGERTSEVRAIIQTRDQRLWIAAKQGVFIYDTATKKVEKLLINTPMLGDYAPHTILEDNKGNIWIGTLGQGVYIYDAKQTLLKRLSSDNALKSNTINHLFTDKYDNIWIATNEGIALQQANAPLGELQTLHPEGAEGWHIINAISEDANGN